MLVAKLMQQNPDEMKLCKLKLRIEPGFAAVIVIIMFVLNYFTGTFNLKDSEENIGESTSKMYLIVMLT